MALIQPLKRHPLLTYFVLAYLLAWAFWIPLALIHPYSYVLEALGDSMPSLLGILLTALFSGTSGLGSYSVDWDGCAFLSSGMQSCCSCSRCCG